jgi:hypothetical protein
MMSDHIISLLHIAHILHFKKLKLLLIKLLNILADKVDLSERYWIINVVLYSLSFSAYANSAVLESLCHNRCTWFL